MIFSPELISATLLTPAVLAFLIGAGAALLKSDLHVPPQLFETLSIYLLLSIGMKGGMALKESGFGDIALPVIITLAVGIITPFFAFFVARYLGRLDRGNAAAVAAHYGSVSAVTFIAALSTASFFGLTHEPYMTALLVLLEIPGIVIGLALARANPNKIGHVLREVFIGKSIVLLVGGAIIGAFATPSSHEALKTVFVYPFAAILTFFMLELGVVAASRWHSIERSRLLFLLGFGVGVPLLFGALGLAAGMLAGLSVAGCAIFATMVASASYIAAPAAVRIALPETDPGIYLTLSIGITLPFNIVIGIPLYFAAATHFLGA